MNGLKGKLLFFFLFLFYLFPANCFADTKPANLISREIVYYSEKASEVTMVWGVNEWKTPPVYLWPKGSYLKDNFVYSVMHADNDSFRIVLTVPERTKIDYVLWLSKDKKGNPFDWWDDNYKDSYHVLVTSGKIKSFDISFDEIEKNPPFNILTSGIFILLSVLVCNIILLVIFKKKYFSGFKIYDLFYFFGLLLALFICMLIVRMQLNHLFDSNYFQLFAALYSDFIFLAVISLVFFTLDLLFTGTKAKKLIKISFVFIICISALSALFNIELIRFLGRPLNFQWLYYSEFLKSNDSMNALSSNLKPGFILNIIEIIFSVFLFAYPLAFILRSLIKPVRKHALLVVAGVSGMIFLIASFFQQRSIHLRKSHIENPIIAFTSSFFTSTNNPDLFTMNIPDSIRKEVLLMHQTDTVVPVIGKKIKHVIVFVLESTPAEYLSMYNKQYTVTPNLEKWMPDAIKFDNFYAPAPSTVKSLFTICSGNYPWVSYKALTGEYPGLIVSTIASVAKKYGYKSSAFSSTSWDYLKMESFLLNHEFAPVVNYRDFECEGLAFTSRWNLMDGVEDVCTTKQLCNWIDTNQETPTISILWTMQTHYPYFYSGVEKQYVASNPELNRYLNALSDADRAFGELMQYLRSSNLLSQSAVIVIGDHGEAFGRHDQTTHASEIYEENVHIPCIIFQPDLFHGERDQRIASLIDIAPTIANLTEMKTADEWQGRSLLSNIRKNRTFFFSPYSDFLFGTRYNNWKLIYNASIHEFELYDLEKDPLEQRNLSEDHPEIVQLQYNYIAAWVQMQDSVINKYINRTIKK